MLFFFFTLSACVLGEWRCCCCCCCWRRVNHCDIHYAPSWCWFFKPPPCDRELASTSTASYTTFLTPATARLKCKKCTAQSRKLSGAKNGNPRLQKRVAELKQTKRELQSASISASQWICGLNILYVDFSGWKAFYIFQMLFHWGLSKAVFLIFHCGRLY